MENQAENRGYYKDKSGGKNFYSRFGGRLWLGRQFRAEYFLPHGSSENILIGCGDVTSLLKLPARQRSGFEFNSAFHMKNTDPNKAADAICSHLFTWFARLFGDIIGRGGFGLKFSQFYDQFRSLRYSAVDRYFGHAVLKLKCTFYSWLTNRCEIVRIPQNWS